MKGLLYTNKPYLRKQEIKRQNKVLYQRVKTVKKTVDNNVPTGYTVYRNNKKSNRFTPVVKHIGPFYLAPGDEKIHSFKMPNYIGSVRVMVVAKDENSYGNGDKTVKVKKPLMVLSTLPRVLSPGERIDIPANIFVLDEKIKDVNITADLSENLNLTDGSQKALSFDKVGDKLTTFAVTVGDAVGIEEVNIKANGNGEGSYDKVNIEVRNPNPYTHKVDEFLVQKGEGLENVIELFGTPNTNEATLEVSSIPPINMDQRLNYLLRYPHGCVEQTTSGGFPQLYLYSIVDLSDNQIQMTERNIQAAIQRLYRFQTIEGGLSYWIGNRSSSKWGSVYAAHFLVEANNRGYFVSNQFLESLLSYLQQFTKNYTAKNDKNNKNRATKTNAYALYVLALAGKSNYSSMNKMYQEKNLDVLSNHLLAAAYAISSKPDIAQQLLANKTVDISPYRSTGGTYGSELRDFALIAQVYNYSGDQAKYSAIIEKIAKKLNENNWYSTHSTSYALISVAQYLEEYGGNQDISFDAEFNGNKTSEHSVNPILSKKLDIEENRTNTLTFKNTSDGPLYVKIIRYGQQKIGEEAPALNSHIKLNISFLNENNEIIDPSNIKQGTDFKCKVIVENLGSKGSYIDELALTQIFPSGWEIKNENLSAIASDGAKNYDYRETKDDRVNTFFDFKGKRTKTFEVNLTATYTGRFYMPSAYVEAMYDYEIQSRTDGKWVEVVK